jgi:hypothetical protein
MDFVRANYPAALPIPGGTIWLGNAGGAAKARIVNVEAYGPVEVTAGIPFNRQPDGQSALWLKVGGLSANAFVELDGRRLPSAVAGDLISALLGPELTARPGRYWLKVVDLSSNLVTEPVPIEAK